MASVRRAQAALGLIIAILIPAAPRAEGSQHAAPSARYAVIIVLDGARPDYLNLTKMPNLHALMARGVAYSRAFVGQLVASTPPSHATIGTGVFPSHHGVVDFFTKDPTADEVLRITPDFAFADGTMRQIMHMHHVPSIAGRLKAADKKARVVAMSGHKCYAADAMGAGAADYLLCAHIVGNEWRPWAAPGFSPPPKVMRAPHLVVKVPPNTGFAPRAEQWKHAGDEDNWTMRYALSAFHTIHYPRLLMINIPETDVLGHYAHGKIALTILMKEFDSSLGALVAAYRKAGILNRTDFLITADHGMIPLHKLVNRNWLVNPIKAAGTKMVDMNSDTVSMIYLKNKDLKLAPKIATNIASAGGSLIDGTLYKTRQHGHWTYKLAAERSKLPRSVRNAYLTLANTTPTEGSADILALFPPFASQRQDWVVNGLRWRQGHEGPAWEEQHIPLIMAGPGIKRGVTSSYPARLVDIAPTIERLLGLNAGGVDGVVLNDALTHSRAQDRSAQTRRAKAMIPLVRALLWRSQRGDL